MSDAAAFTRRKMEWLQAVAADRRLNDSARRIAVLLATGYLNHKTECAWPAVATLANELGTTRRSIQRGIKQLVDLGWLERDLAVGRGHTNVYRIKGDARVAFSADNKRRQSGRVKGDTHVARNPGREPGNNNPSLLRSKDSRRRAGKKIVFPASWKIGESEIEIAASTAGWAADRSRKEFGKFSAWHREHETRSTDWPARWAAWCSKGAAIDSRTTNKSGVVRYIPNIEKHDGVAAGLTSWYRKQQQA